MFYFIKKGDQIEKYEITFDEERLKKLREEIIQNCSRITHCKYRAEDCRDRSSKYVKILNYKRTFHQLIEYNNGYSLPSRIWEYSYDKQIYPYLVRLIDSVLDKDASALYKIQNSNFSKDDKTVNEQIEELVAELNTIKDSSERAKKVKKLQKLIKDQELSINQKLINDYYGQVASAITLTHIDTISTTVIDRVNSFLEKPPFNYIKVVNEVIETDTK